MAQTSLFYYQKGCVPPGLSLEGAPCITLSPEQVVVLTSSKLEVFTHLL